MAVRTGAERVPAWACSVAALAFGLGFALWLLSPAALLPADPLHQAFTGDKAASVIGQRYLLGGPWLWPPLLAPALGPHGTNIALTDSIPLAVLLAKPFRAWLPPGFTLSGPWTVVAFALQPVAAVFALRGAGERRLWPAAAAAVLSVSVPTLLARYGHTALCTHAVILAALGLYLRLVRGERLWGAALLLLLACVLLHPYLFVCAAAVLAAVPLTLLARGERRGWAAAGWLLAGCALSFGLAYAFGFGGGVHETRGFGYYSMNLLGPVLPQASSLLPELGVDATGGQGFEGYQYLGAGLLLLAGLLSVQAVRGRLKLRRHAGLVAVLAACTALAVSNKGYAGHWLLYDLGEPPAFLAQFHGTGRFFWPVTYTCLVAGVACAARLPARLGLGLLALSCLLQVADTRALRHQDSAESRRGARWAIDAAAMRPAFAAHRRLNQWPTFGCGAWVAKPGDMQVTLLASEVLIPTNTVAMARYPADLDCDPAHALPVPLAPGELRVLLRGQDGWQVPGAQTLCRAAGEQALCSANPAALGRLPPLGAPTLPQGALADPWRLAPYTVGWSQPGSGGIWSLGPHPALVFERPAQAGTLVLSVVPLARQAGGTQDVGALLDGAAIGHWRLADLLVAELQMPLTPGQGVSILRLHIGQPTRPVDRGLGNDERPVGLMLRSVRFVPATPSPRP